MSGSRSIVIDANIIAGVFRETIGSSHDLTASPSSCIDAIKSSSHRIVMDDGGRILQEWKGPVDPDWFDNWYTTLVSESNVVEISVQQFSQLLRSLRVNCGFPNGENRYLVKAAATEAHDRGRCLLFTEDMDFYEPKHKQNKAERARHLHGRRKGSVLKTLEKEGVLVVSCCLC